jgi:DNA-binding protein
MEEAKLVKRPAYHGKCEKNEILFSRKRAKAIYYNRIKQLIMEGTSSIKLVAIGAAIKGAVDLALQIEREFANITLSVETGTISLIDDFVDQFDNEQDGKSKVRLNSTITITINYKPV